MGKINVGKVLIGGLLAGLVQNIFDFLTYGVLFKADMEAFAQRLHLDPAAMQTTPVMAAFIICDFLIGLLLVWWYAAIRPRFGAGPKTAIIAGAAVFVTVTVSMYGLVAMGIFDRTLFFKMSGVFLVTLCISSVVGAWVYKE